MARELKTALRLREPARQPDYRNTTRRLRELENRLEDLIDSFLDRLGDLEKRICALEAKRRSALM